MAYLSLYRRHRPLTFSGMTGQEHVARTLGHALARQQLAHAYLFCGPRGTGKTTAAKILARAVNCSRYPVPEPCGECGPCRNIATGVSLDVLEMDAASNRGIEEIRELRERTRYASGESRFKVYIIDEAHMLTNEACNAFLKTLEEPPPGVIFILATTDPSRLPATVVSRCQRFDFHLLTAAEIAQSLKEVAGQEAWEVDDEALRLIARLAEGSMRDALGLLEQCHAYGDELVTAEHVRTVTGATRVETIGALVEAVAADNLEAGLTLLQQVTYSGRDLTLFLRDLTFVFSRLLLSGTADHSRLDDESGYGFAEVLQRMRGRFERKALLDLIELLHQVGGELRHAHHPQFVLEVALIRALRVVQKARGPEREEIGLAHRFQQEPPRDGSGEQRVSAAPSGQKTNPEPVSAAPVRAGEAPKASPAGPKAPPVESAGPRDAGIATRETAAARSGAVPAAPVNPEQIWESFLAEVKKKQATTHDYINMAQSRAWQGDLLVLTYAKGMFAAERIGNKTHRPLIETTLSKLCQKPLRLKVVVAESAPARLPDEGGRGADSSIDHDVRPGRSEIVKEEEEDFLFDEAVKMFEGKVVDPQAKEE